MKTIYFLLAALAASFISYEAPEIREFASTEDLIASLKPNEKIAWMLKVPSGTEVSCKDGIVHIQFPEKVTAWCYNPTSETWSENTSLDYNCKCHSGNGKCSPYTAKDYVGCVTEKSEPCTDCRGTVKTDRDQDTNPHNFSTIVYNYHGIGVLAALGLPHALPILSEVVLQKCPPATAEDIDNPELTGDLFEWLNEIMEKHKNLYANADFSNDQLPAGFGVVPFSIFKNPESDNYEDVSVAYMIVPQCVIEEEELPELTQVRYFSDDEASWDHASKSKLSCSGSCAEGTCVLKSMYGVVKYCDGCKSGCTLHID